MTAARHVKCSPPRRQQLLWAMFSLYQAEEAHYFRTLRIYITFPPLAYSIPCLSMEQGSPPFPGQVVVVKGPCSGWVADLWPVMRRIPYRRRVKLNENFRKTPLQ